MQYLANINLTKSIVDFIPFDVLILPAAEDKKLHY